MTTNGHDHPPITPHFILVPLMAQGHMIPMVDMARLIADRGVLVSFITTPVNAARIKPVVDRSRTARLPIRFVELDFPCAKFGLPQGCENFDLVPSLDLYKPFVEAFSLLQEPLEQYLQEVVPGPTWMIVDNCHWWTAEIARKFDIPRLIFYGPSCFFSLCVHNIRLHGTYRSIADDFETVVIPGLPLRVETTKAHAPGGWFCTPGWEEIHDKLVESEGSVDGVVINTFYDLEPEFLRCYEKALGKKRVWPIGPLSLYNKDFASKASRGNKASIDESRLLSWLDSMEPNSVVFVSFGSLARNWPLQVIELGCGLEKSGKPFIWVMKETEKCPEVEKWLSEGFEERTKGRGMVITGWAPQVVILSHRSIGGFVTHCGWNSVLESVSAGVPMVTWPFFADQFLNEKLVVEVLRIGVRVGVKVPSPLMKEDEIAATRDDVEKAIVSVIDGGEEGKERRERAKGFGEKARMAMEVGGTSYENLTLLIEFATDNAKRYASGKREGA